MADGIAEFEAFLKTLHPQCAAGGCKLPEARRLLVAAEKLTGRATNGEIVSQALWCDQGNHAFSARDLKSEHWERQVKDAKGVTIVVPWDVCGDHMMGINNRLAALEAEISSGNDHPA
jgi:hypothetical protein